MMRYLMIVLLVSLVTASIGCKKSRNPGMATLPPPESHDDGGAMMEVIGDPQPVALPELQPAAASEPMQAAGAQPTSYTIRKGDTLWSISRQVYGSGKRWQDIASANNIPNPKNLRVGQTLMLPQ